jgi:hypothetical protein
MNVGDKLICINESIRIKNNSSYKGKGYQLFVAQVEALKEAGIDRIDTYASGSAKYIDEANGYYTWPRMGYDANISGISFNSLNFPFLLSLVILHNLYLLSYVISENSLSSEYPK